MLVCYSGVSARVAAEKTRRAEEVAAAERAAAENKAKSDTVAEQARINAAAEKARGDAAKKALDDEHKRKMQQQVRRVLVNEGEVQHVGLALNGRNDASPDGRKHDFPPLRRRVLEKNQKIKIRFFS